MFLLSKIVSNLTNLCLSEKTCRFLRHILLLFLFLLNFGLDKREIFLQCPVGSGKEMRTGGCVTHRQDSLVVGGGLQEGFSGLYEACFQAISSLLLRDKHQTGCI